ncbi:MAG: glycosyltransferase [Rhodocyclaceae bacterium]
MKIVLFAHPAFLGSQSMPRFAEMLRQAYLQRGHDVEVWQPLPHFFEWFKHSKLAKWMGYLDQYIVFPAQVKKLLRSQSADTLFVFCDQALGPWVPLVAHRPHVVHVHDLLALRSALGEVQENPTGWTGRIYQRFIRSGFEKGRNFISISAKSREDLHRTSRVQPAISEVVLNGLNYPFSPMSAEASRQVLEGAGHAVPGEGFLIFVGGYQWYKNVPGVLHLYRQYALRSAKPVPLWCVSPMPTPALQAVLDTLPANASVKFLPGASAAVLHAAYSRARALLFPSLAEGFGWPIVEAQACGCPVLTTNEAPMNEVGGPDARCIPRLLPDEKVEDWATRHVDVLIGLASVEGEARVALAARCAAWGQSFDADKAIEGYLAVYERVLAAAANRQ